MESVLVAVVTGLLATAAPDACGDTPLRIMPVGDSITRGTYLGGNTLANPLGGGWRKPLQDGLRAAGVTFEFVGELDYWAYGAEGVVDPQFSPKHHGLAGFSNTAILQGGVVPTPQEVLSAKGVTEIRVPGIVESLEKNSPDIVLLMAGANGFNAEARDLLVQTICGNFTGQLFVASITPQKAPRVGWEQVAVYNASLPASVATLRAQGHRVRYVDMFAALTDDDIGTDGVHPTAAGLAKMADVWCQALTSADSNPPIDIFADAAGGTIHPGGWFSPKEVICGTGDPALNQFYNGVAFFQLPTNRAESANLTLTAHLLYGSWPSANAAIDVWGLGYMRLPVLNAASKAWTLMGDADARALVNTNFPYEVRSAKIADNLVAAGQTVAAGDVFSLNAGQRANLLAFINSLYEKGALPGDYAVIRANPDAPMTAAGTSVRFGGSNTTSPDRRPKLTLTLSNAPAPAPTEVAVRNFSHNNDGTVYSNGVDATYDLISSTLANPTKDGNGVAFLALPEQRLASASLAFTVASFYAAMSNANIDVWGLGYQSSPSLNKDWLCTNDVDPRVLLNGFPPVKLADNIVTSGQTVAAGNVWQPTAVQQANILNYLNGLYERGAKPGDSAVVRLNMDASQAGPATLKGVRWGGSHRTNPEQRAALTGFLTAASNYLANAGFEDGAGGAPSNWTITANGFLGQRTNASVRSSRYAFRMAVHGTPGVTNAASNLNVAQDVVSPDFAGKVVTLSGYVRHDAAEPLVAGSAQKVEVRLYWLGGSQGNIWVTSTDYHNLLPTEVKDAYRPIYVSAVAPEDATGVKAMVIFRSGTNADPLITTGAAFVDDLRLTVFEPLPPSAGTLLQLI